MTSDVTIVGAGPVGLMLAAELARSGVVPVVYERRPELSTRPKGNGLVGRIVSVLDDRGLLERFEAAASYSGPLPGFPFGSVPLDFSLLDADSRPRALLIPQPRLEQVLTEYVGELGVEIRRGQELTELTQDDDAVTAHIQGSDGVSRVRTRYLVGCDGAHSRVRNVAGIGFPGTTSPYVTRMGHFTMPDTGGVFDREIELPGLGRVSTDWVKTERGATIVTSLHPGAIIVAIREPNEPPVDAAEPMTHAELATAFERVSGADLPLTDPIWVSRTIPEARIAERYNLGRIFLAGDAAHLFPAGGAALNTGMLDAVDLGGKLATQIAGHAPKGLLNTYHDQRHPIGVRTLMHTRAQAALEGVEGAEGDALRELFGELMACPEPLRHVVRLLTEAA